MLDALHGAVAKPPARDDNLRSKVMAADDRDRALAAVTSVQSASTKVHRLDVELAVLIRADDVCRERRPCERRRTGLADPRCRGRLLSAATMILASSARAESRLSFAAQATAPRLRRRRSRRGRTMGSSSPAWHGAAAAIGQETTRSAGAADRL